MPRASSAQTGAAPRGVCGCAGYKCVLSLGENNARNLQGPQQLGACGSLGEQAQQQPRFCLSSTLGA